MNFKNIVVGSAGLAVMAAGFVGMSAAEAQAPQGSVTIQKIDSDTGNLLPGASFAGEWCTMFPGAMGWTCQDFTDYSWFRDGLTATGSVFDSIDNDIDQRGGWGPTVYHCMRLVETSAPEGYVASTTPLVVCKGTGGWTTQNAVESGFDPNPTVGDWIVTNNPADYSTVLSLPNTAVPVPTPTPTPTPTVVEPTPTPTPTVSETPTPSPSVSETVTPTPTVSVSESPSVSPTPTVTTVPVVPTTTPTASTSPTVAVEPKSTQTTSSGNLLANTGPRVSTDQRPLASTGSN